MKAGQIGGTDCSRSLTGAWIETDRRRRPRLIFTVAPSRERGLKHDVPGRDVFRRQVAPSRERGLKPFGDLRAHELDAVAPSRERGLKPTGVFADVREGRGRSLTGAWIETITQTRRGGSRSVAPSRERGLKRPGGAPNRTAAMSLPHGSVD